MSQVIADEVFSFLATDVVTRVVYPFLTAVWLGRHWPWAVMVTFIYHFMVALPIRIATLSAAAPGGVSPLASSYMAASSVVADSFSIASAPVSDPNSTFFHYFVAIPCMTVAAAITGALCFHFYSLPANLVPLRYTFTCLRNDIASSNGQRYSKVDQQTHDANDKTPMGYKVWAVVCFLLLSPLGFVIPYEVIAWVVPGGGTSLAAVVTVAIAPLWALIMGGIGFVAFGRLYNLFGDNKEERRALIMRTLGILLWLHAVAIAPVVLVVYFTGSYLAAWITAMASLALMLVVGVVGRYACRGDETLTEHDLELTLERPETI